MTLPRFRPREHLLPLLAGLSLLALVTGFGWWMASSRPPEPGATRVIEMVSITPPPETEPQPEPEPVEPPEPAPEPETVAQPLAAQPVERPVAAAASQLPASVSAERPAPAQQAAGVDRAADAGADSFQLAAGKGGGLFGRGGGGGGGAGDWNAAVALHITRALQRDRRTRAASGNVRVAVMIDATGKFSSARFVSSTGEAALDAAIRDVLARLPGMGRPRPAGVRADTDLNIHLRRNDG